ncbi:SIR2 family NAD-dependent protein deacylase [Tuwongella immobilis]|uniref:NAD-dependent protein deacylase n=1 Tax=Tuwongella immobilis TaxID=692036 RepID=A0A6C2YPA5_9BACT|nr:NAD-dependent deacylase [Tuwongella immobilis]VIP03234.1 nad-dependent protein deacylase : NAD-dependent protein deacylase OS=Singulisphaera acidiphila (strain ATCC BAA-1392 / DSM 18658 / VKM B-2454 / MOB10) GN=cobB PE=3 SV=1: SIR2 [Tuwongella immobilis]VTS03789.1 nad-dependent protein deacylase : NAD-dependent protein deacylase OS=Singulisphaera acidiphila (strain ATCC BAA-1392 / DSM 18658 / VKM B-2454 / MOB10) GN=cobB PE=3 SV=1: SIR2 [Tuwongella immobilis]
MHTNFDGDDFPEMLARAADALRRASRVAVLTGAGVSAESGIPTFRASDGLWENHPIEDVATPMGFERNPELVWRFYNARRVTAGAAKPNRGHAALAQLEQHFGEHFTLITQNVDALHSQAGNHRVLELHGCLRRTRCLNCGDIADQGLTDLGPEPHCQICGGRLRPDIVWFHEMLPDGIWEAAAMAVMECDTLLVVGTSAVVYPAAGLVPLAMRKQPPATVIEINLTKTAASEYVDLGLYGPSGEMLPKLLQAAQIGSE